MPAPDRLDTLAQRLKHARALRKITQQNLQKLSGVKQSDLSKLERGDSLSTTKLVEIAAALRVDPAWLASGKGASPQDAKPSEETFVADLSVRNEQRLGGERQALALSLIRQLGLLLAPLDGADREQAEVLLRKLALDPEQAEQWGTKLARLVGSGQVAHEAEQETRPATERPTPAHQRLLDSLPQRLGAPFQGDFPDVASRRKKEGR